MNVMKTIRLALKMILRIVVLMIGLLLRKRKQHVSLEQQIQNLIVTLIFVFLVIGQLIWSVIVIVIRCLTCVNSICQNETSRADQNLLDFIEIARERLHKNLIESWKEMKDRLKEKYLSEFYRRHLLDELHNLRQDNMSIWNYIARFDACPLLPRRREPLLDYIQILFRFEFRLMTCYAHQLLSCGLC